MKIALYMRLSIADGDMGTDGKDESNSIQNQRNLLMDYLGNHKEMSGEIVEYIDDGYTGTNFNRPGFMKMINDAKQGDIKVLLVKDLSRLGRDYIGVGDYLDQVFPLIGLRCIAVNIGYDSDKYRGNTIGMDLVMGNLVNTLYSRDISKKVKTSLMAKWKQGKCIQGVRPYGYVKCKQSNGEWVIDPETGPVVKMIFQKAGEGWSTKEIVELLNEENILPPGVYANKKYGTHFHTKTPESEMLWNQMHVNRILKRYEYTGASVQHRSETVSVGGNIIRRCAPEEWIIVDDVHPAVVTKKEYEKAQAAIRVVKKRDYKTVNSYPLKGKVVCGNCGLSMMRRQRHSGAKYACNHKISSGKTSNCSDCLFSEEDLHDIVLTALKQCLWSIDRENKHNTRVFQVSLQYDTEIKTLRNKLTIKKEDRIRQYEDYAEQRISKDEYIRSKDILRAEIEDIEKRLASLEVLMGQEERNAADVSLLERVAEVVREAETLTEHIADAYVEKVRVYDKTHVEVDFTFEDVIKRVENYS